MKALFLTLALTLSPLAASAQAHPEATPEATLTRRLLAIEGEPSPEWVRGLGPAGRDALLAMTETDRPLVLRRRAVMAIRHFAEPVVLERLVVLARDPHEDAILSRQALHALSLAFGAAIWPVLAAALDDVRPIVRAGAATELAAVDGAAAIALLRARRDREDVPLVRDALDALLR